MFNATGWQTRIHMQELKWTCAKTWNFSLLNLRSRIRSDKMMLIAQHIKQSRRLFSKATTKDFLLRWQSLNWNYFSLPVPDLRSQAQRLAAARRTGEHKILLLHEDARSIQELLPQGAPTIVSRLVLWLLRFTYEVFDEQCLQNFSISWAFQNIGISRYGRYVDMMFR